MVARNPPICPNCKEPYQGIYADRGKNFVGDTFIRWYIEGHKCNDKTRIELLERELHDLRDLAKNHIALGKLFGRLERDLQEIKKLPELLAILHGDGGHYQSEHGLDKAIEDAIKLIHTKWVTNEHLTDINEANRRLRIMEDLIEYSGAKDYWKYNRNKWYRALEEYLKLKVQTKTK